MAASSPVEVCRHHLKGPLRVKPFSEAGFKVWRCQLHPVSKSQLSQLMAFGMTGAFLQVLSVVLCYKALILLLLVNDLIEQYDSKVRDLNSSESWWQHPGSWTLPLDTCYINGLEVALKLHCGLTQSGSSEVT